MSSYPADQGKSADAATRIVQQVALTEWLEAERDSEWVTLYASAYNHGTSYIQSFIADVEEIKVFPEKDLTYCNSGAISSWSCGLTTAVENTRGL